MTDQIERAKSAREDAARARCNDAVIALKIANRILQIDLLTGYWSDATAEIIPFKRR